jgi:hypothetical protein
MRHRPLAVSCVEVLEQSPCGHPVGNEWTVEVLGDLLVGASSPSSTSIITAVAVNDLVMLPIRNVTSGVRGVPAASSP